MARFDTLLSSSISKPAVNPRRCPAHKSVSLRHYDTGYESNRSVQRTDNTGSDDSGSGLLKSRISSGETSNAENWFENSNKNVSTHRMSPDDGGSPSYLDNTGPGFPFTDINLGLPQRPGALRQASSGGSSEEYRSVIDDLTIQNQKLKRKLKNYERSHDSRLHGDRLFEVKMHGLSTDKRRELEDTLKQFALNLNEPTSSQAGKSSSRSDSSTALAKHSSSLSYNRVADSGYGSVSNPGQGSTPQSLASGGVAGFGATSKTRNRNIRSYLHDIPHGLQPQPSRIVTERAKKRMVVRRLEQIFGGRGPASGMHQQLLQQQEVAQSAAHADRSTREAQGHESVAEGVREALFMEHETNGLLSMPASHVNAYQASVDKITQGLNGDDIVDEQDFAAFKPSGLEQRPTRPLDLDPHRAQVPAENVEYIRHLGFTLPDANDLHPKIDDDGWLYLNLLMNMAQLHTINVTTDFVKKALAEYSEKFELSDDGRKIRWKGGDQITQGSGDGSNTGESSPGDTDGQVLNGNRKRARTGMLAYEGRSQQKGSAPKRQAVASQLDSRFAYQPLFPRVLTDEATDESIVDGASSVMPLNPFSSTNNRHRDNGPLVFYSNATFCTDLSGDTSSPIHPYKVADYALFTSSPIGVAPSPSSCGGTSSKACDRPLLNGYIAAERFDGEEGKIDIYVISPRASPKQVTFAEPDDSVSFEVSGLGGIRPADNMAMTVMRQYTHNPSALPARLVRSSRMSELLPPRALHKSSEVILSAHRTYLPPSSLPPATILMDDNDSDDDDGSETSDSLGSFVQRHMDLKQMPTAFCPSRSTTSTLRESSSRYADYIDDDDDDDDQSVDFLAAARAVNPAAIRAKEREFDAEMAERLAEDIPAGSSAATARGGSGFNTPADYSGDAEDMDVEPVSGSIGS